MGPGNRDRAGQPESQVARTFAKNSRTILGWILTWRDILWEALAATLWPLGRAYLKLTPPQRRYRGGEQPDKRISVPQSRACLESGLPGTVWLL